MLKKTAHAPSNPHPNPLTGPDREHFFTCPHCMQMVDRRDFGAVLLHESPTHRFKHGDRRREIGEGDNAQQSLQPVSESTQKAAQAAEPVPKHVPFTPIAATPPQHVPFTPAPATQQQRVQPFTPPQPTPQSAPAPTTPAPKPQPAAAKPKPQVRAAPAPRTSAANPRPTQPPVATPKPQVRATPAPRASAPNPQPAQPPAAPPKPQLRVEPLLRASAPNPQPTQPPVLPPKPEMRVAAAPSPSPTQTPATRPQPQVRVAPEPQLHSEPLSEASAAGLLPAQPFAQPEPSPLQAEPHPSLNFLRAHERARGEEIAHHPEQEQPPAAPVAESSPPPAPVQAEQPQPKPAGPDLSRFERCLECGGMFDGKELGQVAYHSRLGHGPKSDPNFERLQGRRLTALTEDRIR